MLMDIKQLLEEREQMTLTDLARHFRVSESLMQAMLDKWFNKGRIEKIDLSNICAAACASCDDAERAGLVYRWKMVAEKPIAVQNNT